MILFGTSLVFVLLMYVIPGFLLVRIAAALFEFPAWITITVLNVFVYVVILLVLCYVRHAYGQLLMEREKIHRSVIGPLLRMQGYFWLNPVGVLLTVAGAAVLLTKNALPFEFVFLFAAVSAGLFHIPAGVEVAEQPEDLPVIAPFQGELEQGGTDCKMVEWAWDFQPQGIVDPRHFPEQTLRLAVSARAYAKARRTPRFPADPADAYAQYIEKGKDSALYAVVLAIRQRSMEYHYTSLQEAENVIAMIRALPYREHDETHGDAAYVNFPVETLYESPEGCDREDRAILAAAILHVLGHPVGLLLGAAGDRRKPRLALAYSAKMVVGGFCRAANDGTIYHFVDTLPPMVSGEVLDVTRDFLANIESAQVILIP